MAAARLEMKGQLSGFVFREGDMFVAYTPALDLSSCGRTYKEAVVNCEKAADIFFRECIKDGTLGEVLASLGWQRLVKPKGAWLPPQVVGHFDLPIPTHAHA